LPSNRGTKDSLLPENRGTLDSFLPANKNRLDSFLTVNRSRLDTLLPVNRSRLYLFLHANKNRRWLNSRAFATRAGDRGFDGRPRHPEDVIEMVPDASLLSAQHTGIDLAYLSSQTTLKKDGFHQE